MKQYPNIDAIIEDSDTKVQDLAKVIGVSTKQIRRWRDFPSARTLRRWYCRSTAAARAES